MITLFVRHEVFFHSVFLYNIIASGYRLMTGLFLFSAILQHFSSLIIKFLYENRNLMVPRNTRERNAQWIIFAHESKFANE